MLRYQFLSAVVLMLVANILFAEPFTLKKVKLVCNEVSLGKVPAGSDAKNSDVSPDGKRVYFLQSSGGMWNVFMDGKKGPSFDGISECNFTADSSKFFYIGLKGGKKWAVINGKEGPQFDKVGKFVFNKDGKNGPTFDSSGIDSIQCLTMSPDGNQVAYSVAIGSDRFLVLNGKTQSTGYSSILDIQFSPDSKKLAFIAEKNSQKFVVYDGAPGPNYRDVSFLTFSPNSKKIAYIAAKSDKAGEFVVSEDQESEAWTQLKNPTFSPDSSHLICFGKYGRASSYMYDSKRLAVPSWIKNGVSTSESGLSAFSIDGKKLFYVYSFDEYQNETICLNLDNRLVWNSDFRPSEFKGITISPDGKHVAWLAWTQGVFKGGVDNELGNAFDTWYEKGPVFISNREFFIAGIRGNEVIRFDYSFTED